jgi:hypothetical protein
VLPERVMLSSLLPSVPSSLSITPSQLHNT